MAYELAGLYPEIGRSALTLPLFAAAIMDIAGPALCRLALVKSENARKAARPQGASYERKQA